MQMPFAPLQTLYPKKHPVEYVPLDRNAPTMEPADVIDLNMLNTTQHAMAHAMAHEMAHEPYHLR